ncbi:MAG: toprim domain-containing protein [Clostridium sp.]
MENKKFSFGKVKDIQMKEILNTECLYADFSGVKYLYNQLGRTSYPLIKQEIEMCFKTYAKDYIIRFGKYKGKTIEQVDKIDPFYIQEYLLKKGNEEVKVIVDYYLQHNRKSKGIAYNQIQQNEYNKIGKLVDEINNKSERDIIMILNVMGFNYIEKKGFIKCPHCGFQKKGRWPAYLKKGNGKSYFIGCEKCGNKKDIIVFVKEYYNLSYKEAVKKTAGLLGINENDIDINNIASREFMLKANDEIVIQSCSLEEIDLEPFGLVKGVMHPYFFKRGFNLRDAEKLEVGYSGKNCTNEFKNRICFTIRDINGNNVGVVGRNCEEENEFYDRMIRKHNINKNLGKEEQLNIVLKKYNYIKYKVLKGFNKSYVLYNMDRVSKLSKDIIFVCEGTVDVLKMVTKHNYQKTVGMLGKDLGQGQLYVLYNHYKEVRDKVKIYLFVDNDKAGLDAFETNVKKLQELGFTQIYKMVLDGVKDAGGATKAQVDEAYRKAQLVPVKYKKKNVVLENTDTGEISILENALK